jgi:hypothetical protein
MSDPDRRLLPTRALRGSVYENKIRSKGHTLLSYRCVGPAGSRGAPLNSGYRGRAQGWAGPAPRRASEAGCPSRPKPRYDKHKRYRSKSEPFRWSQSLAVLDIFDDSIGLFRTAVGSGGPHGRRDDSLNLPLDPDVSIKVFAG